MHNGTCVQASVPCCHTAASSEECQSAAEPDNAGFARVPATLCGSQVRRATYTEAALRKLSSFCTAHGTTSADCDAK
jgi:hypothetical protein